MAETDRKEANERAERDRAAAAERDRLNHQQANLRERLDHLVSIAEALEPREAAQAAMWPNDATRQREIMQTTSIPALASTPRRTGCSAARPSTTQAAGPLHRRTQSGGDTAAITPTS
jgi:hypothetical protein